MSDTIISGLFIVLGATLGAILPVILAKKESKKKEEEIVNLKNKNTIIQQELSDAKNLIPKDIEIIDDVDDVLQNRVLPILRQKAKNHQNIQILNFGLDLYSVIPWIKNKIIHPIEFDSTLIDIKSLIIDDSSIYLKDYINGSSNISTEAINSSINVAKEIDKIDDLSKFSFELRQYALPPIFHGFILNNEHLFLGFTEIENGKIIGGIKPYIHLTKHNNDFSEFTNHYFTFFEDWFNYYWKNSKQIVNVKK